MTQHFKQDKAAGTTGAQPKPWSVPELSSKPTTSSANDNDGGPLPQIPLPNGLDGIRSGQRKLIEHFSIESQLPLLYEEATAQAVQPSSRSSWRGTLGVVTYAVGTSIAMFGWIYVLWSALAASVQGILH
jgi:hypothetical protein